MAPPSLPTDQSVMTASVKRKPGRPSGRRTTQNSPKTRGTTSLKRTSTQLKPPLARKTQRADTPTTRNPRAKSSSPPDGAWRWWSGSHVEEGN
ncbi:hypothetical protein F2Q69_00051901 [Brassica cretica]|uniref:Uncharacterized protein n=1 Tax=Brassica cretica TaxID=69181 RepID=A0A8S9PWF9_BRACR|nr:hypothetical protein F2Q69_00051901 [Brassica cretica]